MSLQRVFQGLFVLLAAGYGLFAVNCVSENGDVIDGDDTYQEYEVVINAPLLINTGACTPFDVRVKNEQGQLAKPNRDVPATLIIAGEATLFSDATCEIENRKFTVPQDEHRILGYMQASTIGSFDISYSNEVLASVEVGTFSSRFSDALDGEVRSIFPNPEGETDVIVSGLFTQVQGQNIGDIIRVHMDGSIDDNFITGNGVSGPAYTMVRTEEDVRGIYVIGAGSIDGVGIAGLGKLFFSGGYDPKFSVSTGGQFIGTMRAGILDAQDRIVVGGRATQYNGQSVHGLVRLNKNAQVDDFVDGNELFNFSLTSAAGINALLIDDNQDIYVGGSFTDFGGSSYGNIVRMNEDGSLDTGFAANTSGEVNTLAFAPDGKIYVGGAFTTSKGIQQKRITRLDVNGDVDTTFIAASDGFNGRVRSIKVDDQGRVYVGGDFTDFNGGSATYLVRLLEDGSLDTDFDVSLDAGVNTIEFANDQSGDLWIGGSFTQVNGSQQNYLARLDQGGKLD